MPSEVEALADQIEMRLTLRNRPEHHTADLYLKPGDWRLVIAALRVQDRAEGAGEPFIQQHRANTLRYMLDRAERMSRCFYRAGMPDDGAIYREEVDALTWVLGALPLSPVRMEDGRDA